MLDERCAKSLAAVLGVGGDPVQKACVRRVAGSLLARAGSYQDTPPENAVACPDIIGPSQLVLNPFFIPDFLQKQG